jgi:hypothetical protein
MLLLLIPMATPFDFPRKSKKTVKTKNGDGRNTLRPSPKAPNQHSMEKQLDHRMLCMTLSVIRSLHGAFNAYGSIADEASTRTVYLPRRTEEKHIPLACTSSFRYLARR